MIIKRAIPARLRARWNIAYGPDLPAVTRLQGIAATELDNYLRMMTVNLAREEK